jgi:putative transposase
VPVALRSNSNVVFQCAFHVVWRRVLGGRIEERLRQLVREVIEEKGAWLVALEVIPGGAPLAAVQGYVEQQKSR